MARMKATQHDPVREAAAPPGRGGAAAEGMASQADSPSLTVTSRHRTRRDTEDPSLSCAVPGAADDWGADMRRACDARHVPTRDPFQ